MPALARRGRSSGARPAPYLPSPASTISRAQLASADRAGRLVEVAVLKQVFQFARLAGIEMRAEPVDRDRQRRNAVGAEARATGGTRLRPRPVERRAFETSERALTAGAPPWPATMLPGRSAHLRGRSQETERFSAIPQQRRDMILLPEREAESRQRCPCSNRSAAPEAAQLHGFQGAIGSPVNGFSKPGFGKACSTNPADRPRSIATVAGRSDRNGNDRRRAAPQSSAAHPSAHRPGPPPPPACARGRNRRRSRSRLRAGCRPHDPTGRRACRGKAARRCRAPRPWSPEHSLPEGPVARPRRPRLRAAGASVQPDPSGPHDGLSCPRER